jgi:HD domain
MDDTVSVATRKRHLTGPKRAGLALHAALAAALVPAYLLFAPASHWDDPLTLAVLAVLGVIAIRSEVVLPSGISFEALSALSLIAVAVAGPLPAVLVTLAPIVFNGVTGRERLLRAGNLANVAAYGWYALAGAAILQSAAPDPTATGALGWLAVAGVVQLVVNFAVGPAIYATLWLGHRPRTVLDMFADGMPPATVMVALGAVTVVLWPALGLLALLLFAAIAVLPQSALSYAARTRPVARLDADTATRRYAHALALQLRLSRAERRHLQLVARAARERPPTGDPLDYARATIGDPSGPNFDAQLLHEHWDGTGRPIGLRQQAIPTAARVLAVANAWSGLTAHGTLQLSHHDALERLESAAGTRLDPTVVRAAQAVIAQERVSAAEPAPEPRLHHLRVPAPLRRLLAAS